jgi:hypothetical protein
MEYQMIQWRAEIKPPSHICPQHYCWHWIKAGSHFAPGFHDSLDEAWSETKPIAVNSCEVTFNFGHCSRTGEENNIGDFYEPNEPALAKDGLPWFYFIPSTKSLVPELHAEYISESEALWGKEHWRNDQME